MHMPALYRLLLLILLLVGCDNQRPKTKLIYFGFDNHPETSEDALRLAKTWGNTPACLHWRATIKKEYADYQVIFGTADVTLIDSVCGAPFRVPARTVSRHASPWPREPAKGSRKRPYAAHGHTRACLPIRMVPLRATSRGGCLGACCEGLRRSQQDRRAVDRNRFRC